MVGGLELTPFSKVNDGPLKEMTTIFLHFTTKHFENPGVLYYGRTIDVCTIVKHFKTLNPNFSMKKLVLIMAIAGMMAFTGCSKDNDDSDAIVGTWVAESSISVNGGDEQTNLEVWKFNADSTGSYSDTTNGTIEEESDFKWIKMDEMYQVDYINEDISDETFGIGELIGNAALTDEEGNPIAIRE